MSDAHRMNADTGHDMEHCAFCGSSGRDTLVTSIPDAVFAAPPATFLESRCAYADRGGWLSTLPLQYPSAT